MAAEQKDKKVKKKDDRGAKDDWEALKIVLDQTPSLKQRVLYKIRQMRNKPDQNSQVTLKQQRDFRLASRKNNQKK